MVALGRNSGRGDYHRAEPGEIGALTEPSSASAGEAYVHPPVMTEDNSAKWLALKSTNTNGIVG